METDGRSDDFIARVRAAWGHARPELDTTSIDLIGRIVRIGAQSTQRADRLLANARVSRSEFELLCALARHGRPLRASELTSQMMLSSAATTKLTARLEAEGLIRRERFARDGRVVLFELTAQGWEVVDAEFPRLLADERSVIGGLDENERETLSALLRKVSDVIERVPEPGPLT